jgi:L-asparaginase / beta-aspartyl-peptidase
MFALAIHGGVGVREKVEFKKNKGLEKAYREKLEESLSAGYERLTRDGRCVDAVEAAIRVMEDSPLFNAGKGASFTSAGTHEMDAAIMDGNTLNAGGICTVSSVKNPIHLARLVMEKTPHVLLSGEGALSFAEEQGVALMPPEYFYTERKWQSLQQRLQEEIPYGADVGDPKVSPTSFQASPESDEDKFSTVGAVALDKGGNLAAGTSTGGRIKKRPGRVGDSPIIGAGTYAKNKVCAVSTTGLGEKHMIILSAKEIASLMEYKRMPLESAANHVILEQLVEIGGSGGAVAMDKDGHIAMPYTSNGMYRGYVYENGDFVVKIFDE